MHADGLGVNDGFASKPMRTKGLSTDGSLASAAASPSGCVHAGSLGVQGGIVSILVRTGG